MKNLITIVFACIFNLPVLLYAQTLPVDTTKGWYKSWNDEFDYPDNQLEDNWISQNSSSGGVVLCSRWRENAEIHDGILELKAIKETRAGQDWTCGNVWSKEDFGYGFFECRYKYAGAKGTNNSFWLWPYYGVPDGEKAFELDINEGHYPNIINTNIHNWTDKYPDGSHEQDPERFAFEGDFAEDYHTYGFLWTSSEFMFFFDGEIYRREEHTLCHADTRILLSLAILDYNIAGPVTDDIDGTSMKVDYVRYYQYDGELNDSIIDNTVDTDIANNDTSTTTSTQEFKKAKIYPNPVKGYLNFTDATDFNELKVFNMQGLMLIRKSLYQEESINVNSLPPGMYYYVVEGDKHVGSGTFIKK